MASFFHGAQILGLYSLNSSSEMNINLSREGALKYASLDAGWCVILNFPFDFISIILKIFILNLIHLLLSCAMQIILNVS